MIARYCLRVFGLFLIGCIAPSFAWGQVVLPNNQLLGKDATTSNSRISNGCQVTDFPGFD